MFFSYRPFKLSFDSENRTSEGVVNYSVLCNIYLRYLSCICKGSSLDRLMIHESTIFFSNKAGKCVKDFNISPPTSSPSFTFSSFPLLARPLFLPSLQFSIHLVQSFEPSQFVHLNHDHNVLKRLSPIFSFDSILWLCIFTLGLMNTMPCINTYIPCQQSDIWLFSDFILTNSSTISSKEIAPHYYNVSFSMFM